MKKKIVLFVSLIFVLVGCAISNTPTSKVEDLFNKYQQLEKLNKVIVDEFVDRIYIGKINDETNTRDIEIKWNFD